MSSRSKKSMYIKRQLEKEVITLTPAIAKRQPNFRNCENTNSESFGLELQSDEASNDALYVNRPRYQKISDFPWLVLKIDRVEESPGRNRYQYKNKMCV
ncbi:hypothetical protein D910_08838 [Dendroctonus ponderosae]|uniref:Uncharacterized protein n=1 Tax=Dendroctonus ponderosae TaxID=77166 RepID=U4UGN4_DENPD|nr:hypothetical protein D910_08838 [Dendroctonus ponderosae]